MRTGMPETKSWRVHPRSAAKSTQIVPMHSTHGVHRHPLIAEVALDQRLPSVPGVLRRWLRIGLGLVLAGAALWFVFRDADLESVRAALSDADGRWVVVALISVLVTVAAAIWRWRLLFHPEGADLSWYNLVSALLIGQMLNIMLPFRLGEITRGYWVSRAECIPVGRVLGTIGMEKLADLVTLGVATLVLVGLVSMPPWLQTSTSVVAAMGALAVAGMYLFATRGSRMLNGVKRAAAVVPRPLAGRITHVAATALEASRVLDSWKASAAVGILSTLVLVLAASTNYVLFVAFDFGLPVLAAFVLLVALQIGNAIVSVPGNIGVFHYITVLVLSGYGVDRHVALAYAIALYVIALVPKIISGAALLALGPRAPVVRVLGSPHG